jgi:hypothetical protein
MRSGKLIIILLFTITCILLVISRFRRGECNYIVVLDDNTRIRSTRVNMYNSGFADIRKCSGGSITVRDYVIDTVYIIK